MASLMHNIDKDLENEEVLARRSSRGLKEFGDKKECFKYREQHMQRSWGGNEHGIYEEPRESQYGQPDGM